MLATAYASNTHALCDAATLRRGGHIRQAYCTRQAKMHSRGCSRRISAWVIEHGRSPCLHGVVLLAGLAHELDVGWHNLTQPDNDNVSWHQLGGVNDLRLPISNSLGFGRECCSQGLDGLVSVGLLYNRQQEDCESAY